MATRKARRFDEGGDTEFGSNYDEAATRGDTSAPEASNEDVIAAQVEGAAKPANFKAAFAAARSAGDKTFEWNGKKYTTELASAKPAVKPAAAPASDSVNSRIPVPAAVKTVAADIKAQQAANTSKPSTRGRGVIDTSNLDKNTLLPKRGMKKGGDVKGWGSARGARKAKIY